MTKLHDEIRVALDHLDDAIIAFEAIGPGNLSDLHCTAYLTSMKLTEIKDEMCLAINLAVVDSEKSC